MLSRYISGAALPSYDSLIRLSDALNVTTDELLGHKRPEIDMQFTLNSKEERMLRGLASMPSIQLAKMQRIHEFLKHKNHKNSHKHEPQKQT